MSRLLISLFALSSTAGLAACVDDAAAPDPVSQPTAAERPEIGLTYDVATGAVEEDTALSLAALRDPEVHPPLPGTLAARPDAIEDAIANVIFGSDTRVRVTPTDSFPASGRVRLVLEFSDGYTSAGSGTMIGSKYVLTAGHVVYSHDHGGWATKITAFPGQDGSLKPWTATATKLRSVTGWTEDEDNDYDYGLITLSSNLGNLTGTYCLGSFSDATLDTTYAYIYGYPADKAWGTQWGSGGPIEDYDSTMLYYDTDTYGGMSGAGVYRWWEGNRCVFGVHGGDTYYWLIHYNRAARITNARFNLIESWMDSGV